MPAVLRTPRSRWIAAAAEVLAEGGPDAVRVEPLAASLNVTKGGFYTHFTNREALLQEVLDDWERRATSVVLAHVAMSGGAAADQIHAAGALTFAPDLLPLDLAVRTWARRDSMVRERLRRVDNMRMEFLRDRFRVLIDDPDEVEARSIVAFTLAIGGHFLAADLAGTSKAEALTNAGRRVLFPSGGAE